MSISTAKVRTVSLKILETTDVHGSFFPVNYLDGKPAKGSMARISTYVKQQRKLYGDRVLLLENGDILQGQPTNYYWNFINTGDENIAASIINYMGFNAQGFGNHDIETGHSVYDKWVKEVKCPVIAANVVDAVTGEPYTKPYTVITRSGVRIAVLGMLTDAIPCWLSNDIWSGLRIEDIEESSRKWIKIIKEQENPDLIIGLFHSGREGGIQTSQYHENITERVARQVPGFDIIFYGHDHIPYVGQIPKPSSLNPQPSSLNPQPSTWIVDPSNAAHNIGEAFVSIKKNGNKLIEKHIDCQLTNVDNDSVDEEYMDYFKEDIKSLSQFCNKKIGTLDNDIYASDAFFGSSALTDLVLNLELQITGAQIAFNAPLVFNTVLHKGNLTMADMFNLYKYENKLYTMRLTGREILGHLNMSYDLWTNQMKSPDDDIFLFNKPSETLKPVAISNERMGFKNPFFNFDSAAGIDYIVDVTKPEGQKVTITGMSNGEPFDLNKFYTVAINSYRGNGGGELLTKGAGIPQDSLQSRIITRTPLDQRYYLMKEIEHQGHIAPKPNNNWRFIPDEWAKPALQRARQQLLGK